jgi:signal transduction histidine kinase
MLSSLQWRGIGVGDEPPRLLVLDESGAGLPELTALLEERGYQVIAANSGGEAAQILRHSPPALTMVAHDNARLGHSDGQVADLRTASRKMGIPVLDILAADAELDTWIKEFDESDDWFLRGNSPQDFCVRVARLVRRRESTPDSAFQPRSPDSPIDSRFSSLVVHDLRTPLNVIGLSIRMIEHALPREDPEIEEDLRFIEENIRQIERMLSQLSDYARLLEGGLELSISEFDPRRMVDELLENRVPRPGANLSPVRLDVQKSCPPEAALDQARARMAIEYALINANAAAQESPIRLTLRGDPDRWIVEVSVDRPPPSSVTSVQLRSQVFERLCGSAAERRGMDLAIAARITELFGGSARLEVVDGRGTTLILDWPARITDPTSDEGARATRRSP